MSVKITLKKPKIYELGIAQTLVARNMSNFRNDILKEYELSSAGWFVLGLVQNKTPKGGIRVTDLAAILDVKTTYITTTLNSLREKGYVDTRSDKRDARVRLVVITKEGSKAIAAVEKHLQKETEKFLGDRVTSEQFANYVHVLQEIAQSPAV